MDPHQWEQGQRQRGRKGERHSFVFSIYFMYLALLSLASGSIICMVSLGVSRSCSASHFVFIASFSFFASSLTFSGAPKRFSAAYLNSWKIQLLSMLLLFTSKQFLFFLFVAQINTSSINYPAKETTVCAKEMANRGSFGLHCVRFSDALALSKLIKVWPVAWSVSSTVPLSLCPW